MESITLEAIRKCMFDLRVASSSDKVYKDECVLSFDTPYSPLGLYVNIKTFHAYGADYWKLDQTKTKNNLYLHEVWRQIPIIKTSEEAAAEAPTKLAIAVEGGFLTQKKFDIVKENSLIVVLPSGEVKEVPLPCPQLPEFIINVCESIINHDGMKLRLQASSWVDDQQICESKYARALIQLPNTESNKVY